MTKKLVVATYLPQDYKQRFRREIADVNPDRANAGWHDHHWDGRVDATARPFPVRLGLSMKSDQPSKPKVRMQPLTDAFPVVLRNLREIARLEKEKLMDTMHNKVMKWK